MKSFGVGAILLLTAQFGVQFGVQPSWAVPVGRLQNRVVRESDKSVMESARKFYNQKNFKAAIKAYSRIQKGSEYYPDALEEMAQAYGRDGQFMNALAQLKSAMAPQFSGWSGPAAYSTMVVTQLKTCDYTGVLETSKKFRDEFLPRSKALESLKTDRAVVDQAFAYVLKSAEGQLNFEALGPFVKRLPRHAAKDAVLASTVKEKNAEKFLAQVRQMAAQDLKEINEATDKLTIAEAEVEHRVAVLSPSGQRGKQGKIDSSSDVLVFPDSDEVWVDEIGNYKAEIEKCPGFVRRAGL
jgi:hypothetical protein